MVRPLACSVLLLLGFASFAPLNAAQQNSTTTNQFLSQTKIALVNQTAVGDTYSYKYSLAFPTKTTGTFVITVQLNQRYVPTAQDLKSSNPTFRIYGLAFTSSMKPPQNSASLKFFVPYSSLPPEVVKKLQALARPSALPSVRPQIVAVRYSIGGQDNQGGSEPAGLEGAWLAFEQTIAQAGAEQAEEQLNELLGAEGEGTGGALSELAFSGMDMNEILSLNAEDADLLAQEIAYLDCANDPAVFSPLKSPDNEQNQNQAQSIYIGTEVDVGAQFVNAMASKITGLIDSSEAPLLLLNKASAAGGFNVIGQKFVQLLNADLQGIQQLYPMCKGSWYGSYQIVTTTTVPQIYTDTFFEKGRFHFATQLGTNLKGIISGDGKFSRVGGPITGTGGFSYTGTIYGQTQQGLQDMDQPPGANSNLNAVMTTGPVSPASFNVTWTSAVPIQEVGLPAIPSTGSMPTPTDGGLIIQLRDGTVSTGDLPPPNSPYYKQPGYAQEHYTFTVHQLK